MRSSVGPADAGSLSIEFVIITPLVFLVLALIYLFGQIAQVDGALDASTRDAARVATQAPDYDQALAAAQNVVRDELRDQHGEDPARCLRTLKVDIGPPENFRPGKTITATSTCSYAIADAGIPLAPGSLRVTSSFSSVLDPNRGLS